MNKKYTKEFKREAVKLVTDGGYTEGQAAISLGMNSKNINRWVKESMGLANSRKEKASPEHDELVRLRKENERLKMEKEILKKAAAFFANEKN